MYYPSAIEIQTTLDAFEEFAVEHSVQRAHDFLFHATSLFQQGFFTEKELIAYNKKRPWSLHFNLRYPTSPLGEFGEAVGLYLCNRNSSIKGNCAYPKTRTKKNEVAGIDLILTHPSWKKGKAEYTVQVKVQRNIYDGFIFYEDWLNYETSVHRLWVVDPFARFMMSIEMPTICNYIRTLLQRTGSDHIVVPYDGIPLDVRQRGWFKTVHEPQISNSLTATA